MLFEAARVGDAVDIPSGWGQGRALFGGLVSGVLLARALGEWELPPASLRAMTTSFVAPVVVGPARLEPMLLRRGSSATQVEVRLWQPDDSGTDTVRAVMLASFGAERSSAVEIPGPRPVHSPVDPDQIEPFPSIEGLTPGFFAHVELRAAHNGIPYSGTSTADVAGYMRFREPPARLTLPHFVTLVDAWPPAPIQCLTEPRPMSSLTWTLELLAEPPDDPSAQWWYEVETDAAHHGYAHTHATVFTPEGRPIAISRQSISIFG